MDFSEDYCTNWPMLNSPTMPLDISSQRIPRRSRVTTLCHIIPYFARRTPFAFAMAAPQIRLHTEKDSPRGVTLEGFSISLASASRISDSLSAGVVEDDGPENNGDVGNVRASLRLSPRLSPAHGVASNMGGGDHLYRAVGFQSPLGHSSPKASPLGSDRLSPFTRGVNPCRRPCPNCWEGARSETGDCISVYCCYEQGLQMATYSAWWLSQYAGVSLILVGMKHPQLDTFKVVKEALAIKEMRCFNCVFHAEWLQEISLCSRLLVLVLDYCWAEHDLPLSFVNPILRKPVEGRKYLSSWYLRGILSIGVLHQLRCLHIGHTTIHQDLLNCLVQCQSLECVVLHKCRGIKSLRSLSLLTQLRSLSIHSMSIPDDSVALLAQCKALTRLCIDDCRAVKDVSFLPHLRHSLKQLTLSRSWISDEHLPHVAACAELEELRLFSLKRLSDVSALASLTRLRILHLGENGLQSHGYDALACMPLMCRLDLSACRSLFSLGSWISAMSDRLVSLDLSSTSLNNTGVMHLSDNAHLRYLNLSGCSQVSHFAFLRGMTCLRWLSISGTGATNDGFEHVGACWRLRYLALSDCTLVDNIDCVQYLPQLEYLCADGSNIGNANVGIISVCETLKYVNLHRCGRITNVSALGNLPNLVELDLSHTKVTSEGISHLRNSPSLQVLNIRGCCAIARLDIMPLAPSLKELIVDYFQSTHSLTASPAAESIAGSSSLAGNSTSSVSSTSSSPRQGHLSSSWAHVLSSYNSRSGSVSSTTGRSHDAVDGSAAVPGGRSPPTTSVDTAQRHLLVLSVRMSCWKDDELATVLLSCPFLRRLDLTGCSSITDLRGLESLKLLTELRSGCTNMSNLGVKRIGRCKSLEILTLEGCLFVTDVNPLGDLSKLKELNLTRTSVTDEGLKGIATCSSLVKVILKNCRHLTDVNFLGHLQQLRELRLDSTNVRDAGVAQLCRCRKLERVHFTKCLDITYVDELRQSMPRLEWMDVYGTSVPMRNLGKPTQGACLVM